MQSALFAPLRLRSVEFANRVGVPPMCQYSARDGFVSDWHVVHYGTLAKGGAGMVIVEATAVTPQGRISSADVGLWKDEQIAGLKRIVDYAHREGARIGVQLAHAGRKASVSVPFGGERPLRVDEGGWQTIAPSAVPFHEGFSVPQALDAAGIESVVAAFAQATRRAYEAGFDFVEIHAAHGYLIHQFLSPLANQRQDAYGGSFENRARLALEITEAVRRAWPEHLPLLVRISATDWAEGGWNVEESVQLARALRERGVDLMDVSTGGLVPHAKIPAAPGFQVEFAARIRREAALPTAAVGLITTVELVEAIVAQGEADVVLLGRELLRNPYWPLEAAETLGEAGAWPAQYLRAAPRGSVARQPVERPLGK